MQKQESLADGKPGFRFAEKIAHTVFLRQENSAY